MRPKVTVKLTSNQMQVKFVNKLKLKPTNKLYINKKNCFEKFNKNVITHH